MSEKNISKMLFSKERVELGLLQDIQADYDFLLKNFSGAESKFYDAIETASVNKKLALKDLDKLEKLQKDIDSAERKLKEIGLDNQVTQLNKIKSKADEMIKSATRIKNMNV